MSRVLVQLAKAAGLWVAAARAHFRWSEDDLADRIEQLYSHFRTVRVPTVEDIRMLEAGRERHLPAWVKFARLAVEREELRSVAERVRWAETRSPWQGDVPHEDFDCCWPVITRPEFHMLEQLDLMPEAERRMAFRLAAAWNSPYPTRNRVFAATIAALETRMHPRRDDARSKAAESGINVAGELIARLCEGEINLLRAYLACDNAGRTAIVETALREYERVTSNPRGPD